jgi:hypothetical protein
MRSYAEPIIAHPDPASHLRSRGLSSSTSSGSTSESGPSDSASSDSASLKSGAGQAGSQSDPTPGDGPPSAFLWRGRHYAVRAVVATWLDQAPWWRGGHASVRRCWRVEASAGMASGTSVVDLVCDADGTWHLLAVID